MKTESKIQLILGVSLGLILVSMFFGKLLQNSLVYRIAGVFFGILLETMIIVLFLWWLKHQHLAVSRRRLFWSRTLFFLIIASAVCAIGYFFIYLPASLEVRF